MITEKVKQYIDKNKLCSEYIFSNWNDFLELLYSQGGCVESILWFEYVLVSEQKNSLGSGGYIDKTNSDYMYAETGWKFGHIDDTVKYNQTIKGL